MGREFTCYTTALSRQSALCALTHLYDNVGNNAVPCVDLVLNLGKITAHTLGSRLITVYDK